MSLITINDEYLSAIGTSIRNKNGTTDLIKPKDMAAAIDTLPTGGVELPEEAFNITGSCTYRFSNNGWNWFIEEFGNRVTTKDITNCSNMFYQSTTLTNIPFEINCKAGSDINCASAFAECTQLTSIPKINNCKANATGGIFKHCYKLRYLPEDIESWFDWSGIDEATSPYGNSRGVDMLGNCFSLRSVPMGFLNHENQNITSAYNNIYYCLFNCCNVLDEIVGLPVHYRDIGITSNFFINTFYKCQRLKNITFATQEDGTPYIAKWKNQTIDLTTYVGYTDSVLSIVEGSYNSGITADKQVTNDATYQALKNDPDWFTLSAFYSRYNHDSAVATINSLPDTSAYGTNTIKFNDEFGDKTDGGGIRNLTEEEIAVAAAKGWTVSLV